MIPQFKVRMSPKAIEHVGKVLASGYIGQGPKVDEFESRLRKELNSNIKPITVNSCTSAIDLALHLIGVKAGDEIISTPQTCFASQVGAINRNAKLRWADINPKTGCICPESVKKLITKKTKAIIAVNWAGKFCDYKELKNFNIPIIEDAAHCWDVFKNDNRYRGDYICYSFQAIKFLTSSDGGALITPKDKEKEARLLRWYGLDRNKGQSFRCTQNITMAGYKYHMNDVSAAIGIENISYAKDSVMQHRSNSKFFIENIDNKYILNSEWDENCSFWIHPIYLTNSKKEEFIEYMRLKNVACSPVHFRNDKYDCTSKFAEESLPGVDRFTQTQVCIPNGWWLTNQDLEDIVNLVNEFQ